MFNIVKQIICNSRNIESDSKCDVMFEEKFENIFQPSEGVSAKMSDFFYFKTTTMSFFWGQITDGSQRIVNQCQKLIFLFFRIQPTS